MGEFVGKELQGDVAAELKVFRLVNHTHAPAADLAVDAVMGHRLTHGLGGRGHWLDMLGGKVNEAIELPASSGERGTPPGPRMDGRGARSSTVITGLLAQHRKPKRKDDTGNENGLAPSPRV